MDEPTGVTIAIKGIRSGAFGCSCHMHPFCGVVLNLDTVLRLKRCVIERDGTYAFIIGAFWVTNGIDHCRVGYLPEEYNIHHERLEGRLVQVMDILDESHCIRKREKATTNQGLCMTMLIDYHKVGDDTVEACADGYYTDSSVGE